MLADALQDVDEVAVGIDVVQPARRGYLVGIAPQVLVELLKAAPVHCALAE